MYEFRDYRGKAWGLGGHRFLTPRWIYIYPAGGSVSPQANASPGWRERVAKIVVNVKRILGPVTIERFQRLTSL